MHLESVGSLPHPSPLSLASYSAVELALDNATVWVLDQRLLPAEERYVAVRRVATLVQAIAEMWVRGAPAIGIAAAYGVVLAAQQSADDFEFERYLQAIAAARPTAVNLNWAVERMRRVSLNCRAGAPGERVAVLAAEARRLHEQDVAANRSMGRLGAEHISDGAVVLTHCNAGALATGGYGTALGVVRAAREAGKRIRVFADETRPWLQGARLTAWELARDGIDVTVLADSAAASLFRKGQIDLAVVGADRVTRNGDVANKIGTYGVACLCHMHQRPFYVAAPFSTVDLGTPDGDAIVIEQRAEQEITEWNGRRHVHPEVRAINPSFDVTPARLVTALFTEIGVATPLDQSALASLARRAT